MMVDSWRYGVVGSVTPLSSAVPNSPLASACVEASPTFAAASAASVRALNSSAVRKALFGSHGGGAAAGPAGAPGAPPRPPPPPPRGHVRSRLMPPGIGQTPCRSGSPQAVFGWTHPLGVSMKWFDSLAGPRTGWGSGEAVGACALAATTNSAAATAPRATRFASDNIRYIVQIPYVTKPSLYVNR